MSNVDFKVTDVPSRKGQKGEGQRETGLRNDLTMPEVTINGATEN